MKKRENGTRVIAAIFHLLEMLDSHNFHDGVFKTLLDNY